MEGKLKYAMEIKNYNNDIPDDNYEVMSVLQDINGTLITLDGINNEVKIRFGAVDSICVTDEGLRMETYLNGKTKVLNEYRAKKFYGNPFFIATSESDFTLWLKKESWGFSEGVGHYLIITLNHIVDIASVFPPQEIIINKKNNNLKSLFLNN